MAAAVQVRRPQRTTRPHPRLTWQGARRDFGYLVTDQALERVLNMTHADLFNPHLLLDPDPMPPTRSPCTAASKALCDYVLFTNGDNYYHDAYLPATMTYMRQSYNLIGVYYLSHFQYKPGYPYVAGIGPDVQVNAIFSISYIDLGCVQYRADILRQHRMRFVPHTLASYLSHAQFGTLDGMFVSNAVGAVDARMIVMIRRVLFVHQ